MSRRKEWIKTVHVGFFRLLAHSKCLEELDLEDNLIGDLGGQELLNGLSIRKEGKDFSWNGI